MKPAVILATVGSLGDLHPFIALGRALKFAGAGVTLACAAEYQDKVERAGLAFRGMRPSFADLQRTLGMTPAQMTRAALARNDFLLRRVIMPHVRVSYDDMLQALAGADLVLTSSLAFGARFAAERLGVPWLGVVLQPLMFLSAFDPPAMPHALWMSELLRQMGPVPTQWVLGALKSVLSRQLRPLHDLRAAVGLPPMRENPLFEGQFSATGALALYSPLLAGDQPDHPAATAVVGFAPFDSADGAPPVLDAALEAFLDAGPPPLVFTLGSLIVNSPGSFFRESITAALHMGRRAVLLVGEQALTSGELGSHAGVQGGAVHVCAYAPHSLLFPRAEAVVHQGGIGTLAQALRAGRPQVVVPHYGDQWDNAARARRLGVARSIAPRHYDARSACRALARMIGDPSCIENAARVGRTVSTEDGASRGAAFALARLAC